MMAMKVILARTSEVGSRALVHGVIPDLAVEAHGKFLTDCKVRRLVLSLLPSNTCGVFG